MRKNELRFVGKTVTIGQSRGFVVPKQIRYNMDESETFEIIIKRKKGVVKNDVQHKKL